MRSIRRTPRSSPGRRFPSITRYPRRSLRLRAPSSREAGGAPSPADVVVDAVQTDHVVRGNTLWGESQKFYGDGSLYKLIFAANANQIKNPNLIYPGQVFVVPKEPKP